MMGILMIMFVMVALLFLTLLLIGGVMAFVSAMIGWIEERELKKSIREKEERLKKMEKKAW